MKRENAITDFYYTDRDSAFGYLLAVLVPIVFQLFATIVLTIISLNLGITITELLKIGYVAAIYYSLSSLSLFALFLIYNKVKHKKTLTCAKINFRFGIVNTILVVLLALIVLFGFNYIVNLFAYLVGLAGYTPDTSMPLPLNTPLWLVVNLFCLALFPAICEEVIYRGIILNGLRKFGNAIAIFISAIVFTVAHGSLMQFLYQFALGIVLGYIVVKTGSIVASMIAHFVNNATVIIVNYISTTTGISIDEAVSWSAFEIVFAIVMAALTCFMIYVVLSSLKCKKEEKIYVKSNEKIDPLALTLLLIAGGLSLIIWCVGTFL